jgi:secondary thiamine-phosphate synthase enzyme
VDRAVDRTAKFRQNGEHPGEPPAAGKPRHCSPGPNHNPRVGGSSPSSGIATALGDTPVVAGASLPAMGLHTEELCFSTRGDGDVIDITGEVQALIADAGVEEGQALAFVRGSTAAISTMEFEPGGIHDLREMFERLIPAAGDYEHNRLNHDSNSHAHQRATLVGPSETVPVLGGRLALGTWQQLVLIDFDDRPRERTVIVQILG